MREHFGACDVFNRTDVDLTMGDVKRTSRWCGSYPTMEGAIDQLDPFQARPLLHIELGYVEGYISGKY